MEICKICNREYKDKKSLGAHIKFTHKIYTKNYYDIFYKQLNEDLCQYCYKNKTKFISLSKGYREYCSKSCMSSDKSGQRGKTKKERYGNKNFNNSKQMKETKKERYGEENFVNSEKAKSTNFERRGVTYIFDDPKVLEKSRQTKKEKYNDPTFVNPEKGRKTCLEKYGVDSPFQCEDIKEKIQQTKLERYGNRNYNNQNKRKETNLWKYGVDEFFKTKEFKNKIKEIWNSKTEQEIKRINIKRELTCLEKYGVRSVQQVSEIMEKQQEKFTGFKNSWHDYQLPSGGWIKLQGYEPQALDILLKFYNEEDIFHRKVDMPEIWYKTNDNINHRYYPDFYIPKDNLIVEVKSNYTYECEKEKNELKMEATKDNHYNFKLMIIQ